MPKPKIIKPKCTLVSRSKAFEMRGVKLRNARWSWGGIRESDGMPVMTMWASSIQREGDNWRYLLWKPNKDGKSPWSNQPGGKERLKHCQLSIERGEAEGLLIYGDQRGRELPLDQISQVEGADPYRVIPFKVEQKGEEYWAVWTSSVDLRLTHKS